MTITHACPSDSAINANLSTVLTPLGKYLALGMTLANSLPNILAWCPGRLEVVTNIKFFYTLYSGILLTDSMMLLSSLNIAGKATALHCLDLANDIWTDL
jgi:hypothetical protein